MYVMGIGHQGTDTTVRLAIPIIPDGGGNYRMAIGPYRHECKGAFCSHCHPNIVQIFGNDVFLGCQCLDAAPGNKCSHTVTWESSSATAGIGNIQ